MIEELQEILPNITRRQLYRILLSIKMRDKKYNLIGLSRLEASKYGLSERQFQKLIYLLRNYGYIVLKGKIKPKLNSFKCNVYKVASFFRDALKEIKDYVKKEFEYIEPIQWVKSTFNYKIKCSRMKFEYMGIKYFVHLSGCFKGKIYNTDTNKLITVYNLIKGIR